MTHSPLPTRSYRVLLDYASTLGEFSAGDEVTLAVNVANAVNRDQPNTLEWVKTTDDGVQSRVVESSTDRMVRAPRSKRHVLSGRSKPESSKSESEA